MNDERDIQEDGTQRSQEFYSEGGLKEFTEFIDQNREKLIPEPMYMEGEIEGIPVEVSMIYNTSYAEIIHSYVNNINTHEGGTHLLVFAGLHPYAQEVRRRVGYFDQGKN